MAELVREVPVYGKETWAVNADAQLLQRVRDVYSESRPGITFEDTVNAALHNMMHGIVDGDREIHTETDLATRPLSIEESDTPLFTETMHVEPKEGHA